MHGAPEDTMADVVSMTGFGRAGGELSPRFAASLVVRAVNHRYLDVGVRTNLREDLPEVEAAVRDEVTKSVQRGRVSVQLNLERKTAATSSVLVEREAVVSLLTQLDALDLPAAAVGGVRLRDVLGLPGLVTVSAEQALLDDDEIVTLGRLAARAVAQLVEMRRAEGARLVQQIRAELDELAAFVLWFEPQMAGVRERLLGRIRQRLEDLIGKEGAPEERMLQEAALQADRSDVAEEVVRLQAHLAQFGERLSAGGVVGRSLDFLCQEINRELNTLGSKCREADVAARLVDAKTGLERIREQVQNLE